MAQFTAVLQVGDTKTKLSLCRVREGYNAGWSCDVFLFGQSSSVTLKEFRSHIADTLGIEPGKKAILLVGTLDDDDDITIMRSWPCIIDNIRTETEIQDLDVPQCHIHLVDPITYMATNPIWGAYRSTSFAEIIGGVLSMAGGGSGAPTLNPVLKGMPTITITHNYRESLDEIPYIIAAGETLEEWLDHVAGQLGIRYEMLGNSDGSMELMLYDKIPSTDSKNKISMESSSSISTTKMYVYNYSYRTTYPYRGYVLDDAALGDIMNYGEGSVGRVISEHEVGWEESIKRVDYPIQGSYLESFQLYGKSQQPGYRPGRLISLTSGGSTSKPALWQLSNVFHSIEGNQYTNKAYMLQGERAWYPMSPPSRSPVLIGATVDSGLDYNKHDPVSRDRLGQIFIRFPFIPTSSTSGTGESVDFVDSNNDGMLTLDDFDDFTINDFTQYSTEWEADLEKYETGDYNGLYEGQLDSELTPEQLIIRNMRQKKKKELESYKSYKQAKNNLTLDKDGDGVITLRDDNVSDELSAVVQKDEKKDKLRKQWEGLKTSINTSEFGRLETIAGMELYTFENAVEWDKEIVKLNAGEYDPISDQSQISDKQWEKILDKRQKLGIEKYRPDERELTNAEWLELLRPLEEKREMIKRYIVYREMAIQRFIEEYQTEGREELLRNIFQDAQDGREQKIEELSTKIFFPNPVNLSIYRSSLRGHPDFMTIGQTYIHFAFKFPDSIINFLVSKDAQSATRVDENKRNLPLLQRTAERLLTVIDVDEFPFDLAHFGLGDEQELVVGLYAKKGLSSVSQVMHAHIASPTYIADGGAISSDVIDASQGLTTGGGTLYDYDLIKEYGLWFDKDYDGYFEITKEQVEIREKAEKEAQKWPPRIPLSIVGPIAGAFHGFIPSHRQGDSCRVAVYSPFSAEIIGFQYRSDQKISADNVDAITGLIVDHNGAYEWSGILFRETTDNELATVDSIDPGDFFSKASKSTWLPMVLRAMKPWP